MKIKKLTAKQKNNLEKACIRDFFYKEYKNILRAGTKELASLGMEASLEACEGLFDDGRLIVKVFDKGIYSIILKHSENSFELLYDSTEG